MKKSILLFNIVILSLIVSSCTFGGSSFLKRSASNKVFDTKGMPGSKRRPLYNKKYIDLAKKNVSEGNYDTKDEDADTETRDYEQDSVAMYQKIMDNEKKRILENMKKNRSAVKDEKYKYPDLNNSRTKSEKVLNEKQENSEDLQKQIEEMKFIIDDMKKKISSSNCNRNQDYSTSTSKSSAGNQPINLCPIDNANIQNNSSLDQTDPKICTPN